MARHILDRPFDQERFTELKRAAQTALNTLRLPGCMPGRLHEKNGLYCKLLHAVSMLEKYGESYYQFEGGCFDGQKSFYTLDDLEEKIERVNKFLGYT